MRAMPARGERGRFLGRTGVLEFVPRLGAKAAARLVADPRGCAYGLSWRPEDTTAGIFGCQVGVEGRMEILGDALLVTVAGRPTVVRLKKVTPYGNAGWYILLRCPYCPRTTGYLYLVHGTLACRRCAGLRWGSEGRRWARLEGSLHRLLAGERLLEERFRAAGILPPADGDAFSWKLEEKPWEVRTHPLAGPLLPRAPKKRGRRPRSWMLQVPPDDHRRRLEDEGPTLAPVSVAGPKPWARRSSNLSLVNPLFRRHE